MAVCAKISLKWKGKSVSEEEKRLKWKQKGCTIKKNGTFDKDGNNFNTVRLIRFKTRAKESKLEPNKAEMEES